MLAVPLPSGIRIRIDEGGIANAAHRWQFISPWHRRSVDNLSRDKSLDVRPELSSVFGRRPRRIFGDMPIDVALRHARVHAPRVRLPDQNLVTLMAEMPTMRIPKWTLPGIRARRAQQHGIGNGRHPRPDRIDDLGVRFGTGLVGSPIRKFVEQGGDDSVAARRPEAGGVDFDRDAVPQLDRLTVSASISLASIGTALSNPVQYRMITRACRRSAADDANFARSQIAAPVFERRQEHSDGREHEAFAAPTTAHEPSFMERGSRGRAAAGEPPIGRKLIVRHGQPEWRGQAHATQPMCQRERSRRTPWDRPARRECSCECYSVRAAYSSGSGVTSLVRRCRPIASRATLRLPLRCSSSLPNYESPLAREMLITSLL
jgi:hypothetical protein